ncbi:MAG: hypothetical protein MR452_07015 [Faecalibacterium prausnitzii]|nr:hypothetical protein [Faecalibacterium prausnitzii]
MKMAKKFLAVALAGVLALSVLTGCGASVKSKDVADALTKMDVKTEQSKDVDKTAENTLKAIEAIINSETNTKANKDRKITLDNAVKATGGKVINRNGVIANAVKKALGVFATGSDAEKANVGKQIRVALVKTEDATKDASLQAAFVKDGLVQAQAATVATPATHEVAKTGKLGTATTKDGKYMLVVIVNDVVAKANT